MERKYIILMNEVTGKEYAVIFDKDLSHEAVSRGIERTMTHSEWAPRMFLTPVAAGFLDDTTMAVNPTKKSESLKMGPRFEDQFLLRGEPVSPPEPIAWPGKIPAPRLSHFQRAKNARAR